MKVTSMWSSGYLQPARESLNIAKQGEPTALATGEQQILAQERALKAASTGAKVTTVYRYAIGPDGRRYITGAEVTIQGDEQAVDRVGGGIKREHIGDRTGETKGKTTGDPKPADGETGKNAENTSFDDPAKKAVRELQQIERDVVAHEAAHQAAGGRFAGAVSYSYTRGPDGKSYITGGEVPIHVPPSSDPEQAIRDMEQVQRAALAPGDPSGQDLSVAAQAAATAAQARQELSAAKNESALSQTTEKTGFDVENPDAAVVEAAPRFRESDSQAGAGNVENAESRNRENAETSVFQVQDQEKPLASQDLLDLLKDAYARSASPHGLWAWGRGFDPVSQGKVSPQNAFPRFDFAA